MNEYIAPVRTHVVVWLVLLALTGLNIGLSYIRLAGWNGVIELLVASVQASLIAVFLMHLRWSSSLVKLVALAAFLWLAILIGGTLNDVLTRAWLQIPR